MYVEWSLPEMWSVFFLCMLGVTQTCKVLNWRHMGMKEIFTKADIVVYGKETKRFNVVDSPDNIMTMLLNC